MTFRRWPLCLAGVVLLLLAVNLWLRWSSAPVATLPPVPPVYAYDLKTRTWFVAPGGSRWPCPTPSGEVTGVEVVMARAPDGTLVPVLLSRSDTATDRQVVEGRATSVERYRRLVSDPSSIAWVEEDSQAAGRIYAGIKALSAKGYVLDVRPSPTPGP